MGKTRNGVLGFTVGVVITAPFVMWDKLMEPIPYRDVHIVEQWREGDYLHITATFIKTDCTFKHLVAEGFWLGLPRRLPVTDRDVPRGDRLKGVHALRINIGDVERTDEIELRTRHECYARDWLGRKVVGEFGFVTKSADRIFARIDPKREVRPPETISAHGGVLKPVH